MLGLHINKSLRAVPSQWLLNRSLSMVSLRRSDPIKKGYVSPMQSVPPTIVCPEFAKTGRPGRSPTSPKLYSAEEIPRLRKAARLARKMLEFANALVKPGMTTNEIDVLTHQEIVRNGAYPTPLNYCGFPKSICTSVNEVVCHGIPDSTKLKLGDIISIDVSLFLDGVHGDNCGTVVCGSEKETDPKLHKLIAATKLAVDKAIGVCKPGACISEIGETIQEVATRNGYGIVHEFCGHGTGTFIHMPPLIMPHSNNVKLEMKPGMAFTIEPIFVEGSRKITVWEDDWTAATFDGGWSAQIEHEVLITKDGVEVLTVLE